MVKKRKKITRKPNKQRELLVTLGYISFPSFYSVHTHTYIHSQPCTHTHTHMLIPFLPYIFVAHMHLTPFSAELSGNSHVLSLFPNTASCITVRAKPLQLCLTLCDSMDCSPPGSSVHGILQARVLEWVAMPSSRGSSRPRDPTLVSCISCTGRQVLYRWRHLGLCQCEPRRSAG